MRITLFTPFRDAELQTKSRLFAAIGRWLLAAINSFVLRIALVLFIGGFSASLGLTLISTLSVRILRHFHINYYLSA